MRYGTRLAGLGIALCAVATVTSACGAGRATTADEPALFAGTNSSSVPAQRPATTAPVPQAPSASQPPVSRPPVSHCAANQAATADSSATCNRASTRRHHSMAKGCTCSRASSHRRRFSHS